MSRLKPDLPFFPVVLLQGGVLPLKERDDHLSVTRRAAVLHDDVVAVAHLVLDHRLPFDPENVDISTPNHVFWYGHHLVGTDGLDRLSGGNQADEGHVPSFRPRFRGNHLDGPSAVPVTMDESLLLQVDEVLVYRGYGVELEVLADFNEARSIAVFSNGLADIVQDLFLAFRKDHGDATV